MIGVCVVAGFSFVALQDLSMSEEDQMIGDCHVSGTGSPMDQGQSHPEVTSGSRKLQKRSDTVILVFLSTFCYYCWVIALEIKSLNKDMGVLIHPNLAITSLHYIDLKLYMKQMKHYYYCQIEAQNVLGSAH